MAELPLWNLVPPLAGGVGSGFFLTSRGGNKFCLSEGGKGGELNDKNRKFS